MSHRRILVCGGRDIEENKENYYKLNAALAHVLEWVSTDDDMGTWLPPQGTVIIHGDASGADRLADSWAIVNWTGLEVYKADWDTYGRAAGPIRNQLMLDKGNPDVVVAFPGGRGTQDMVDRATKAGIPVFNVVIN